MLTDEELAAFYEEKLKIEMLINQYLILRNSEQKIVDKLRWDGKKYQKIKYPKINGFKSRNFKQDCLMDLLLNDSVPIKIIAGCSGSGKTCLAVTTGMHLLKKGKFERIFVVRHEVAVGEKIGFLPGDQNTKSKAWLKFFEDNLFGEQSSLSELIERGSVEVDSVSFLKGRSIANSFMIIDECEDLEENQFRMIGERTAMNSVISFVGDIEQVTQEKYRKNSGLKRAIDKLKGNPLVGIVVFDDAVTDNVRSKASKVFSSIY